MVILFLIGFGFYFLSLLALLYGWERSMQESRPPESPEHSITLIVPMRNEAKNIKALIKSIEKQNYSTKNLQVLLVNDHSTDETLRSVLSQNLPKHFVLIDLPETVIGKKAAITYAITAASGDIIVTTDADCTHQTDWLKSINNQFSKTSLQLLVGPVAIKATNLFSQIQAIEFSSLIGSGAAMLQFGMPAMANGANLAFRKTAFQQVNGYEGNQHIASGDDEFLLKKLCKAFPQGVTFNNDHKAVVETTAQPTVAAFFQQRLRWASKWKQNQGLPSKIPALTVFFLQLANLVLIVNVMSGAASLWQVVLLSKFAIDAIFLWTVCSFLRTPFRVIPFFMVEFLYPIYVIITALLSQIISYHWRGRKG